MIERIGGGRMAAQSGTAGLVGGRVWVPAWSVGARVYVLAAAAILAAGLAARLLLAFQPMPWLVTHSLPDDSFYYFTAARNIAHGHGVTLDGATTTNGFHPLWMAALVPIFAVSDGDAAVRIALTLSAALDTGTALLVLAVARMMTPRRPLQILALALYVFNPASMANAVNGMETAFSLFCSLLLIWLTTRALKQDDYRVTTVAMGFAAGLAILARTDNVVLVAASFGWLLVCRRGSALRPLTRAVAVAAVVAAPWFFWSMWAVGSPVQVSAEAAPYIAHTNFSATGGDGMSATLRHSTEFARQSITETIPRHYVGAPRLGVLSASLMLFMLLLASAPLTSVLRRFAPLLPAAAATATLMAADTLLRWHIREWYFPLVMPLGALAVMQLADTASTALGSPHVRRLTWLRSAGAVSAGSLGIAVLVYAFAATGRDGFTSRAPRYPQQQAMYDGSLQLADDVAKGAVIAGFNSGILSFYDGHTTVNLDGVMNPGALAALRDRRLAAYLKERDIAVLVDFETYIRHEFALYWGSDIDAVTVERWRIAAPGEPQFAQYTAYDVIR